MPGSWRQEDFEFRLDEWIELEQPDPHLRRIVTAWTLSRLDDPYRGMRREAGFENLWFGVVPGSYQDGSVVVCSLWIDESSRIVRCDRVATLSTPL